MEYNQIQINKKLQQNFEKLIDQLMLYNVEGTTSNKKYVRFVSASNELMISNGKYDKKK